MARSGYGVPVRPFVSAISVKAEHPCAMSRCLDRLLFFRKHVDTFSDRHGQTIREDGNWKEVRRNRERTTEAVDCTGFCSWNVHLKTGIVAFEIQVADYPETRLGTPNHEPGGCLCGAS